MPKRVLTGKVVSDSSDKTIKVLVERKVKHPVLGKVVRKSKKITAHDENNAAKSGDIVSVVESKPISKTKTWVLLEDNK